MHNKDLSDSLLQTRIPSDVAKWVEAQATGRGLSRAAWLRELLCGLHGAETKGAEFYNLEIRLKRY